VLTPTPQTLSHRSHTHPNPSIFQQHSYRIQSLRISLCSPILKSHAPNLTTPCVTSASMRIRISPMCDIVITNAVRICCTHLNLISSCKRVPRREGREMHDKCPAQMLHRTKGYLHVRSYSLRSDLLNDTRDARAGWRSTRLHVLYCGGWLFLATTRERYFTTTDKPRHLAILRRQQARRGCWASWFAIVHFWPDLS
jgi:hypothetical protein